MAKSTRITDIATRDAVKELEDKLRRVESVTQLPADATLKQVIDTINKITSNLKRK